MSELSLRAIDKVYPGGVHAVRDFNLDIHKGEFIVFVGPSGCGKSTMLRMIAGLETITNGDLAFNGMRLNDVAPADRDFAMVFQNYALFGTMTVYENIGLPLVIRHLGGDETHEKIMEAARTVEITPELNRKPAQLSGGQRQRVAIGRSLVRNPKVFLMDEPLSNLDAKLRAQTRKELATLQRRLGTTFIYVTHDQVEAMTLADRIVIMDQGVIQQVGTPIDVYRCPANVFVGGFIGSPPMNFVRGTVADLRFQSAGPAFSIPESRRATLNAHQVNDVIVGVRPEHFQLQGPDADGVEGRVEVVEYLGHDYIIHFSVGGSSYRAQIQDGNHGLRPGDSATFFVDGANVSFFDAQTKARIGDPA